MLRTRAGQGLYEKHYFKKSFENLYNSRKSLLAACFTEWCSNPLWISVSALCVLLVKEKLILFLSTLIAQPP
jgi:hypothetical protein